MRLTLRPFPVYMLVGILFGATSCADPPSAPEEHASGGGRLLDVYYGDCEDEGFTVEECRKIRMGALSLLRHENADCRAIGNRAYDSYGEGRYRAYYSPWTDAGYQVGGTIYLNRNYLSEAFAWTVEGTLAHENLHLVVWNETLIDETYLGGVPIVDLDHEQIYELGALCGNADPAY